MGEIKFNLDISYSQLVVFQKGTENPFNDWEDTHVSQGFAWRPESVSFGSLLADEKSQILIDIQSEAKIANKSIRTIVVPFKVLEGGIVIASTTQEVEVDIIGGSYELVFNIIPRSSDGDLDTYYISFIKTENPKARLLLADEMLTPPDELLMIAQPAI